MDLLFSNTDEIREYLPLNVSFTFDNLKPFIDLVQDEHIIPAMHHEQFNELFTAYNANNLTPEETKLLKFAQAAIANLAMMEYLPHGNVQVSTQGIQINSNESKKAAFQWQVKDLQDSYKKNGFNAIDKMLAYLEQEKVTFSLWANSDAYTEYKDGFIQTTKQFSDLVNIGNSRRVFLLLKPTMRRVEREYVKAVTCGPLYENIREGILNDNLSNENKILLVDYIQPAVAHLTIMKATTELSIQITEKGITVFNSTSSSSSAEKSQKAYEQPSDTAISALKRDHLEDGKSYLDQLRDYLQENADNYPLFKNSNCYVADEEGLDVNDDDTRGVYFL